MSYLQLFLQSAAIEITFLLLFFRSVPALRLTGIALFANALTHPLFVFGCLSLPGQRTLPWLLGGEALAVLGEALIFFHYLKKGFGMSLAGALAANLLSWELGPRLGFWIMKRGFYF